VKLMQEYVMNRGFTHVYFFVFGGYIATLLSKTAPSNTFLAFRMMVIIFTGVWFSAFLYDYLKHRRRYKNT